MYANDSLMGAAPNTQSYDKLNVLGTLVEAYEAEHRPSLTVQRLQIPGEFGQGGGADNNTVFDDLFAVEPQRLF